MFSQKAKLAAMIYQGLTTLKGKHADHIIPKSKGGADDVANLQFISIKANLKKGARLMEKARHWQEEFWKKWDEGEDRFLLVAIPGAGKTIAALAAARKFLYAAHDRCVLIVVPSVNLQGQWRSEAHNLGIELVTKNFGENFGHGFVGAVVTYQALDSQAQILRSICAHRPTLVIMDEPHHCGDKESWGYNAKEAFTLAKRILLLSGTPCRTDKAQIPFLSYDADGNYVAHYRYDYPTALNDGVVRYLEFESSRGAVHLFQDGKSFTHNFDSGLADEEARKHLSYLLNAGGDWVREQLQRAHQRLLTIRQVIPDAAAMAVCMDQQHAHRIGRLIEDVTKTKPSIIVSDEEIATDSVATFRHSKNHWLVCVRQVSEGTDIKRLQVLCYLTNMATELFFRQVIGRVSRIRYADSKQEDIEQEDRTAYVFLPDDPRLNAHARNIYIAQQQAIQEQIEKDQRRCREMGNDFNLPIFLGSQHLGVGKVIIGSQEYNTQEAERIRIIADQMGIPEIKAALVFDQYEKQNKHAFQFAKPTGMSLEEKRDSLLKTASKLAWAVSKKLHVDVREIHMQFPPHKEITVEQGEAKIKTLRRWFSEGRIS